MGRKQRRGPSNRTRFIARARTLKESRDFQSAIAAFRETWDQRFPAFAIGTPGVPPEKFQTLNGVPMPESLMATWERWRNGLGSTDPDSNVDTYMEYHRGEEFWVESIFQICREFWPPDDFPHGLGEHHHPAVAFVAGCFMYQVLLMDEAFVFSYPLQVERYPHHPRDRDADPFQVMDQAKLSFLEEQLRHVRNERRGASLEEIRSWISRLETVGFEAARPLFQGGYHDVNQGWFCVSLTPELTSLDWRDAEASVLGRVREIWGDDFVGSRIRYWHEHGKSNGWIARRMGVTPRTVATTLGRQRGPDTK